MIKRLIGFILFILGLTLLSVPFLIAWIIFGINKPNIVMSTIMRVPQNLLFGDNFGDDMLKAHKYLNDNNL